MVVFTDPLHNHTVERTSCNTADAPGKTSAAIFESRVMPPTESGAERLNNVSHQGMPVVAARLVAALKSVRVSETGPVH